MNKADQDAAGMRFEEAIKTYFTEIGYDEGIITDWVLVAAQHIVEDGGGSSTATSVRVRPDQADYRTLGLMEQALTRAKALAVQNILGPGAEI